MKNKRTHLIYQTVIVATITCILIFGNFTTVFATDAIDNVAGDVTIATDAIAPSDVSITPRGTWGPTRIKH